MLGFQEHNTWMGERREEAERERAIKQSSKRDWNLQRGSEWWNMILNLNITTDYTFLFFNNINRNVWEIYSLDVLLHHDNANITVASKL